MLAKRGNEVRKKKFTRRSLLKGAGAMTVLAICGSVWRAYDQGVFSSGKGPAYEPWKTWKTDVVDGPLALIQSAILAATPHNTQPWLFEVAESRIAVYADIRRHLGAMDPYFREMHIGLGCAVENMILAGSAKGYVTQVTLTPGELTDLHADGNPVLAAVVDLSPGKSGNLDLYNEIPNRHTDRAPYDMTRTVTLNDLQALRAFADKDVDIKVLLLSAADERARFSDGTVQATKDIIADNQMAHDSAKWFRHDWDEVQKHKDGPFIDTAGVSPMMRALAKILPPVSEETGNGYWLDATVRTLASSPVVGLIAVRDLYDRPQAMNAGRVWQRMHLLATKLGLSMQPVNQLMEIVDRERQVAREPSTSAVLVDIVDDSAWQPTFGFRLGYPTMAALLSPRRHVEEVLI